MYFVDRKNMEETVCYIEHLNDVYAQAGATDSPLAKLALERIVQGWIEAVIDVGNKMIDGFIMRDPGSYDDIVDILEDEKVIHADDAHSLKNVIALRKPLVQQYTQINHERIEQVIEDNKKALEDFPNNIREYVEKELGPVSAFLPEQDTDKGKQL
ncbi:DUF86 domain-containing protein [Bacillus piscicola]|uniref:DUF86 domain-containing protein n=1 Tax=Bacillus piscicola TaxID=1632684 RepID=UPI001F090B44|nr:DUF86 domain-containing protein [Bacillus piscicola]